MLICKDQITRRVAIRLQGAIQGVGFRPFVYRLASQMKLTGFVSNSTQGVVIEAEGPAGKFTVQTLVTYAAAARTLRRMDKDSRGFEAAYDGTIGGDLCGFYTIRYESAPFSYAGKQVRLKSMWRVVSPLNTKVQSWVSVDGGEYQAFGNPWWEKEIK